MPSRARNPRDDWQQRFRAAAQAAGDTAALRVLDETGRMVARKDSLTWTHLSRFGNPWPPFDFGSKRILRDVRRAEAEALGLVEPETRLAPRSAALTENTQASVSALDPALAQSLQQLLGAAAIIVQGIAKLLPRRQPEAA